MPDAGFELGLGRVLTFPHGTFNASGRRIRGLIGTSAGIISLEGGLAHCELAKNENGESLPTINAQTSSISAATGSQGCPNQELLQLMRQRAEIMKRIGTVKQTIAGLANLFGDQVLDDDLLELIDRKP